MNISNQITPKLFPSAVLMFIFLALVAFPINLSAMNAEDVPKKMQTSFGLYFSPAEAYEHMQQNGSKTLFIDLRDPTEVNFTGMPTVADANVPFKFANTKKWNLKKKQFDMVTNKNFANEVEERLSAKGLDKTDTVILMCRSGPRGGKAANVLAKSGFTKVYNLIEGFEGFAVKDGSNKGQRTINGWKNAGLPWDTPKGLDVTKMYGNPEAFMPKAKK